MLSLAPQSFNYALFTVDFDLTDQTPPIVSPLTLLYSIKSLSKSNETEQKKERKSGGGR